METRLATAVGAAVAASNAKRKDTVFTRDQVENLIARGQHIVIIDGKVLRVDAWLRFHPGGDKAIKHVVGRDGTDEVNAFHSAATRQRMNAFQIGRIEGRWTNFLPPIQGGKFRKLAEQEQPIKSPPPLSMRDRPNSTDDTSDESEAPSPVFETMEQTVGGLRKRRRQDVHTSRSSSATSLSSLDIDEEGLQSPENRMTDRTKQEVAQDLAKYPALEAEVQDSIVQKYRLLNDRMIAMGLYDCNYAAYGIEMCRYTFLAAMSLVFLRWGWYAISGLFVGLLWHQLVFTAHDLGHMGATHNFQIDTILGILISDYIGGLSLGWWKANHNVHHVVTNSPEHDPDIEHMPFFAISHRFFESLRSTYYERIMTYDPFAKFMIRYQAYLYYPILTFGRFNLYRLSWEYLLLGKGPRNGPAWWHRYFEILGHLFFWTWYGYGIVYKSIPSTWGRISFVLISHMVTAPLHVQITLSHFAMSTADLGVHESFPQKMLRTTMDVACPAWLDFLHGGLQFQAIHHLYPRMPRHNLREAQKLVQQFCDETEIPYALYGFLDGNKEVIGRLGEIGRQAKILAECQRVVAQRDVFEH